jgi:hypothetical protein
MQLHEQFNMTPFRTGIGFCQDNEGRDLVVALLKATFHFAANGPVAAATRDAGVPLFKKDVFHGEPATSSLRYATDVVPSKPGVDIAVVGHAYGRDLRSIEAGFALGACEKVLRVLGPRCWVGGRDSTIAGPVSPAASGGPTFTSITGDQGPTRWRGDGASRCPLARSRRRASATTVAAARGCGFLPGQAGGGQRLLGL